jgi:GxxExxY protein
MKHEELTHKIIGCAMKVHATLGNGFQEIIYHKALAIEFSKQRVQFISEQSMSIFYEGIEVGNRRVDFFIENIIMLEIKAQIDLQDIHLAQALNYLEASNNEIGLLINFGSKQLQFKRLYNNKLK